MVRISKCDPCKLVIHAQNVPSLFFCQKHLTMFRSCGSPQRKQLIITNDNEWKWTIHTNGKGYNTIPENEENKEFMHYCLNTIRKLKLHVPWTKMCINLFLSYQHCKTVKSIFKISWNNMSSLEIYITSIKQQFYCLWRIYNVYILDNSNS